MTFYNGLLLLAVLHHQGVHSQFTVRRVILGGRTVGDCSLPTVDTLTELIPRAVFSENDGGSLPLVSISDHIIVCQATGLTRGTVGSFSAVVTYTCDGTPSVCDNSTSFTDQFQFDCGSDNTYGQGSVEGGAERTEGVTFTLDPPRTLEEQCGQCVQAQNNLGHNPDPDSHCVACPSVCNEGQGWCTSSFASPAICCNWYVRDRCVVTCPGALQGDMETFDCGCGELQLDNGNITYTNRFAVNSTATHTCDTAHGYVLSGSSNQRTCDLPANPSEANWSGDQITCELFTCDVSEIELPKNGNLTNLQNSTFGSVVTYSCEDNFVLVGEKERTCTLDGWAGSIPTCIFTCNASEIEQPENGNPVSVDSTRLGSVVTYSCKDDSLLVGKKERTCMLNGWTGNNPICVKPCSATTTAAVASVITAIITALLATVIFTLLQIALCKYHNHKSREVDLTMLPGRLREVEDEGVDEKVKSKAVSESFYMEIGERREEIVAQTNEAYDVIKNLSQNK